MVVCWNRGTPKSSILIAFSIINQPFWIHPLMETPIWLWYRPAWLPDYIHPSRCQGAFAGWCSRLLWWEEPPWFHKHSQIDLAYRQRGSLPTKKGSLREKLIIALVWKWQFFENRPSSVVSEENPQQERVKLDQRSEASKYYIII